MAGACDEANVKTFVIRLLAAVGMVYYVKLKCIALHIFYGYAGFLD